MTLIQRSTQPPQRGSPVFRWTAIACFSAALFLLTISFGSPSDATLDASWTEVLAWATLKHAQWGRDIVFTYGPLGFLHGTASYVPGILGWFVTGQIGLTAAFVLTTSGMLHRSRVWVFFLFAVAYAFSYPWILSDVSWAMTMLFGTTALMNCDARRADITSVAVIIVMALLIGAIALIKFSLLPLWILCVAALAADSLIHGSRRRAMSLLVVFPVALLFAWFACGQELGNLPGSGTRRRRMHWLVRSIVPVRGIPSQTRHICTGRVGAVRGGRISSLACEFHAR